MKKVLILDTSILCVWLDVPGMARCGPAHDSWDKARVANKIETEERAGTTFVLPLASIIETGNHIAQAAHSRFERAQALASLMDKSAQQATPWAAFSAQSGLWASDKLADLAQRWPAMAAQKLSLGDATISDVANSYAQAGYSVEILTGDQGLKACEPAVPLAEPRRRQRR